MSTTEDPIDRYFALAIEKKDLLEREAWLNKELGDQPEVLQQVRNLIADYVDAEWMENPPSYIHRARRLFENRKGQQIGPFLLSDLIGSGGMGDVYLARQIEPVDRLVAVKLILVGGEHGQVIQRFQREKQALADMEHPNIARIIDAGSTGDGVPYIAMEFVKGLDLLEYCKSNNLQTKSRVELILQCCRAIQHAHQKGIIHRDIKPNNVLVTQVDGEPMVKVIDFGIAKALGSKVRSDEEPGESSDSRSLSSSLTSKSVSPGTPPFMSPEQFGKSDSSIDTRSDIYSLGALMYVALTEQKPFDASVLTGKSFAQIGRVIGSTDPVLPSHRAPHLAKLLSGDIDSMVRKAMHRDAEKRYQSIAQFAEDLKRYLSGDEVSTNPHSAWTQLKNVAKRNWPMLIAACLAFSGLLVGWIFAELQRKRQADLTDEKRHQLVLSELLTAGMRIRRQEYSLAQETLHQIRDQKTFGGFNANQRLDHRALLAQIPDAPDLIAELTTKIYQGVFIKSKNWLACCGQDSSVYLIDSGTRAIVGKIETGQKEANGVAVHPDQRTLVSAGDDGTIKFWDIETGDHLSTVVVSNKSVFQAAWSPDGRYLITVGNENGAKVWSYPDCKLVRKVDSAYGDLECTASSQHGMVAFGDEKGRVFVGRMVEDPSDSPSESFSKPFFFEYKSCSSLAFSPSGRMLAIGLNSGYLVLLTEGADGYEPLIQVKFPFDVSAVAFSPDEGSLAIGESNGSLHVLNLSESRPMSSKLVFSDLFFDLHPDSFSGLTDKGAKLLRLREMIARTEPDGALDNLPIDADRVTIEFKEPIHEFVFTNQFARQWFDATQNQSLKRSEFPIRAKHHGNRIELMFRSQHGVWMDSMDLHRERQLTSWTAHDKRISSVAWSADGRELYSFSDDAKIRKLVFKAPGARLLPAFAGDLFALSNDEVLVVQGGSRRLQVSSFDSVDQTQGSAALASYQTGEIVRVGTGPKGLLIGRQIKSDTGGMRWRVDGFESSVDGVQGGVEFPEDYQLEGLIGSPSHGKILGVFASVEHAEQFRSKPASLGLWDIQSNAFVWKNSPNKAPFRHAQISPDGRKLLYESDAQIRVVDVQTGVESVLENPVGGSINSMKISPDGRFLAVATKNDRSIRCYRMQESILIKEWEASQHGSAVLQVAWSKDPMILMSVSEDGFLRFYDMKSMRLSTELLLPVSTPLQISLSPDQQSIFVLDASGAIARISCPTSEGS